MSSPVSISVLVLERAGARYVVEMERISSIEGGSVGGDREVVALNPRLFPGSDVSSRKSLIVQSVERAGERPGERPVAFEVDATVRVDEVRDDRFFLLPVLFREACAGWVRGLVVLSSTGELGVWISLDAATWRGD